MTTLGLTREDADEVWQKNLELYRPLLEHGQVFALLLDDQRRIAWANTSFWALVEDAAENMPFVDCLTGAAAKEFARQIERRLDSPSQVELHHPVAGGVRIVTYQFIVADDGRIAAIGIDRSDEVEVVQQMASMLEDLEREIAQRIELSARLEELVITDALTGIHNRRYFDKMLAREWSRFERYKHGFTLLLIDLDHFKSINDTHGHQLGDEVLRRIANTLRNTLRASDVIARYGGEEFAVIAPEMNVQVALQVAERLRENVKKSAMPEPIERVTVSIGVASTAHRDASSPDRLVRLADAHLYRAKDEGRDRVVGDRAAEKA